MPGAVDVVRVAAQSRLFIIIAHPGLAAHTIPLEEKKVFVLP